VKLYPIEVDTGITEQILTKLQNDLKCQDIAGFKEQVRNLYKLFLECDAVQL
jgi:hypothetical protein